MAGSRRRRDRGRVDLAGDGRGFPLCAKVLRRTTPGRRRSGLGGCPPGSGAGSWEVAGSRRRQDRGRVDLEGDGRGDPDQVEQSPGSGAGSWERGSRRRSARGQPQPHGRGDAHQGADDQALMVCPRALAPGSGRWQAVGADGTAGGSTWQATAAATSTRWSAPRALAPVGSWAAPSPSPRPRRRSPGRRRSGLDASLPGSGAGSWERAAVGADRTAGGSTWKATAPATLTGGPYGFHSA